MSLCRSWCFWLFALAFAGCSADRGPAPPVHEFLIAAGDSTFWVRGDSSGIQVRGAPLLLARLDGRFHELYLTDDDRSYFDAVLIGQRLWRRDLVTGDSVLVFEDSLVPSLARAHSRAYPDAVPLAPDEDASDEPAIWASIELGIIDVHGPYLSYEYHADLETRDGDESHVTNHGVLDLGRAERATLASLYGARDAARLEADGRARFSATVDSMLRAGDTRDPRATEALAGFFFDPRSFTIVELNGSSAIVFAIPGRGPHAGGLTLELDPIPAGSPEWWSRIRPTLPDRTDEHKVARWHHGSYAVLARYVDGADAAVLSVRDTLREWEIATVPAPVSRIEWLDQPAIDSTGRRALARAFDEAALYDVNTSIAMRERSPDVMRLAATSSRLISRLRIR